MTVATLGLKEYLPDGQEVLRRSSRPSTATAHARPVRHLRLRGDGARAGRDQARRRQGNDRQAVIDADASDTKDRESRSSVPTRSTRTVTPRSPTTACTRSRRRPARRSTRRSRPSRANPRAAKERQNGGRAQPARRSRFGSNQSEWKPPRSTVTAAPAARGDVVRGFISRYGLIVVLLLLPVCLRRSRTCGRRQPRADSRPTSWTGLSNGSIWALIAIGYTLVYGIIELINFAHGDVFMIGTFVAVGAVRHDRPDAVSTGAVGLFFGLLAAW